MEQGEDGKQIALWAYKLTFNHPVTKEEMSFKVLPEINGTWKIIEGLEDKSENNSKIIIICKSEDYDKNKDKISKELIKYQNAKVTNERFVLDSFYFYTNLENEIDHPDYKVIQKQNKEDFYDFY